MFPPTSHQSNGVIWKQSHWVSDDTHIWHSQKNLPWKDFFAPFFDCGGSECMKLLINDPLNHELLIKSMCDQLLFFYQTILIESLRIWSLKVSSSGILQRWNSTKDQLWAHQICRELRYTPSSASSPKKPTLHIITFMYHPYHLTSFLGTKILYSLFYSSFCISLSLQHLNPSSVISCTSNVATSIHGKIKIMVNLTMILFKDNQLLF